MLTRRRCATGRAGRHARAQSYGLGLDLLAYRLVHLGSDIDAVADQLLYLASEAEQVEALMTRLELDQEVHGHNSVPVGR